MRPFRGTTARAGLIVAALILQPGCTGLGQWQRDREGRAALEEIKIDDPNFEPAAEQAAETPAPPAARERSAEGFGPRGPQGQPESDAAEMLRESRLGQEEVPDPSDNLPR